MRLCCNVGLTLLLSALVRRYLEMRLCCNKKFNLVQQNVRRYLEMRLCCNMKHTENVRRYLEMRLCCNVKDVYIRNGLVKKIFRNEIML